MLQQEIEEAFDRNKGSLELVNRFLDQLDAGKIRAAEKAGNNWQVNMWVKKGILLAFRLSKTVEMKYGTTFFDKEVLRVKQLTLEDGVRVVPGGTTIRRGTYLEKGVVVMPPTYVNIGAWVGSRTMLDSHVLIGSCAQIGSNVHISAGVQIGGVLEPVGNLPVIIEENAFIGGNCGLFDGVVAHKGAVIAAGVQLTKSTPLFDCINEKTIEIKNGVLEIPENAVVVAGTRKRTGKFAEKYGLASYAALILKYRDNKTDAVVTLENALR